MVRTKAPDSKVDRIVESFLFHARSLRVGTGAHWDYRAVYDWVVPEEPLSPALLVLVGRETTLARSSADEAAAVLDRVVEVVVEARATLMGQTEFTPREVASRLLEDCYRIGLADVRHGGAAIMTTVADVDREADASTDEISVAVRVVFEVRFRTRFVEPTRD